MSDGRAEEARAFDSKSTITRVPLPSKSPILVEQRSRAIVSLAMSDCRLWFVYRKISVEMRHHYR